MGSEHCSPVNVVFMSADQREHHFAIEFCIDVNACQNRCRLQNDQDDALTHETDKEVDVLAS